MRQVCCPWNHAGVSMFSCWILNGIPLWNPQSIARRSTTSTSPGSEPIPYRQRVNTNLETVATKPGCSGAAHAIRLEIALFAEGKRFSSHRTGLSLGSSGPRRANLESDPVTLLQSPNLEEISD